MRIFGGKIKEKDPKKLYVPEDEEKPYGNSSLTEEKINMVKAYASIGMNKTQIAECLGISVGQFNNWLDKYEKLIDAWNKGVMSRRQRAFTCYMSQAFPMSKNKKTGKMEPTNKGNPQLMIQYMKSVEDWSETNKQIVEDERKSFDEMDKSERISRIQALEKKLAKQKEKELEEFIDD